MTSVFKTALFTLICVTKILLSGAGNRSWEPEPELGTGAGTGQDWTGSTTLSTGIHCCGAVAALFFGCSWELRGVSGSSFSSDLNLKKNIKVLNNYVINFTVPFSKVPTERAKQSTRTFM